MLEVIRIVLSRTPTAPGCGASWNRENGSESTVFGALPAPGQDRKCMPSTGKDDRDIDPDGQTVEEKEGERTGRDRDTPSLQLMVVPRVCSLCLVVCLPFATSISVQLSLYNALYCPIRVPRFDCQHRHDELMYSVMP